MARQRWLLSGLCCLVPVLGGTAIAQSVILDFHGAKVLGAVHIAGGTIELEGGAALIVTTSAFGFVPFGTQANEYMVNGVGRAEYGTPAIHDAIVEGANFAHGFWNGTNGFVSLDAQYQTDRNFSIGWLDNAIAGYTSWYGKPVNSSQTIIATTWLGDTFLEGSANDDGYHGWESSMRSPGNYLYGGTKPDWIDGDFNYDGRVDSDDYGLWSDTVSITGANFDLGFSSNDLTVAPADGSGPPSLEDLTVGQGWNASQAPEPGSLALLMSIATSWIAYRGMRRGRCRALAGLTFAAILAAPQAATAMLYLNTMVDPATPGYAANVSNNGYTYAVNAADQNTTVILDVYALIKDASPSLTDDGLTKLAGNFYLSNQALVGAIGFNSWGPQINTLASNPSIANGYALYQWAPAWGGLALGGTSATDSNASDWWVASEGTPNQTGGIFVGTTGGTQATSSGAIGTEFYLGQLTVSFSGSASPGLPTTAQLLSTPRTGSAVQGKPYQWSEGSLSQNTYGTASTIAGGSGNLLSLFPLNFFYGGYHPGKADLSALALSDTRTMTGGSLSVSCSLTNTTYSCGSAQQDTLANWTVGGADGFSAQSSTNLAAGSSAAISPLTYTAGATTGLANVTLSSSGTGANARGVVAGIGIASIAVLNNRAVMATSPMFPLIHLGQAIAPQPLTLLTTGDDNHFTRVTVGNAGPDANGLSVGGGVNPIFNGPAVTDTRTLSGIPKNAGVIGGTITLAASGEGLPGESPLPIAVTYSGQVFSGSAAWYGGSGSWGSAGSNANWTDTATFMIHAAPGVWGFNRDAATLGTGNAGTVALDGPVALGVLVFNNSTAVYALVSGSGGTLHLNNGAETASVTVAAGDHAINAPLVLETDTSVAVNSGADSLTIRGPIGGSGGLGKVGPGRLTLTGSNTYSGGTTISGGTLQLGDGATGNGCVAGTILDDATLAIAPAASLTYTGQIGGSGSVTKLGAGTVVLSGSNSYLGGTHVEDGTLILTSPNAIADGTSLTVGADQTFAAPIFASNLASCTSLVTTVPEPGTKALLAIAFALVALYRTLRARWPAMEE